MEPFVQNSVSQIKEADFKNQAVRLPQQMFEMKRENLLAWYIASTIMKRRFKAFRFR